MSAFHFIFSAEDTLLYEQRLERVTRGRKYLELLKAQATHELETALQDLDFAQKNAVQIVEKGYEANKRKMRQLRFQVEVSINRLNEEFDFYLRIRENEVSKVGSLVISVCQPVPTLLKGNTIDNSLELLEVVIQSVHQSQHPLEEYLSIVLDPRLREKEAESALQMAENESRMEDFIHLQNAVLKCSDYIALSHSEKATEMSNSLEYKLKEIKKERHEVIRKLLTSDSKAVSTLIEIHMKDIRNFIAAQEWDKAIQAYLRAISFGNAFSCSKETAGLFSHYLLGRSEASEGRRDLLQTGFRHPNDAFS